MGVLRIIVSIAALVLMGDFTQAQQSWKIEKLDAKTVPAEIVPDKRPLAINGIPNGRVALGGPKFTIKKAWYALPTKRYGHGALGDKIEGGSLVVVDQFGSQTKYQLPDLEVFEDLTPRLADLDGDGKTEIITITADILRGASISVFELNGNSLVRETQTKSIGRRFRWLNIAGIERYSGTRTPEIAAVITPHIGGTLTFYKMRRGKLVKFVAANGFSNHVFGSIEQRLSASYPAAANGRTNLALPSAQRNSLIITSMRPNGLVITDKIKLPGAIDKAIAVKGNGSIPNFTVGLEDGSVYSITR